MKDDERRFLIDLYNAENTPKGKEFNPIIGELINVTDLPRDIISRQGCYINKLAYYRIEFFALWSIQSDNRRAY